MHAASRRLRAHDALRRSTRRRRHENDPAQTHSIVIVGGGFAGTALARALDARRTPGLQVTLVVRREHHHLQPDAARGGGCVGVPRAGGRAAARDARSETRRLFRDGPRHRRRHALAHAALPHAGRRPAPALRPARARVRQPRAPGPDSRHGAARDAAEDGGRCAAHPQRRVATAGAHRTRTRSASCAREIGHFVVIGGGFSGVEVAGELVDCLASIRRFYPRVRDGEAQGHAAARHGPPAARDVAAAGGGRVGRCSSAAWRWS